MKCGWYEKVEVNLSRQDASRIVLDDELKIAPEQIDKKILGRLKKLGVLPGFKPLVVDDYCVTTKSAWTDEVRKRAGDSAAEESCSIVFQTEALRSDIRFASCPLFQSEDPSNYRLRYYGKELQKRFDPGTLQCKVSSLLLTSNFNPQV